MKNCDDYEYIYSIICNKKNTNNQKKKPHVSWIQYIELRKCTNRKKKFKSFLP